MAHVIIGSTILHSKITISLPPVTPTDKSFYLGFPESCGLNFRSTHSKTQDELHKLSIQFLLLYMFKYNLIVVMVLFIIHHRTNCERAKEYCIFQELDLDNNQQSNQQQ